jgi:hypothetical protein
MKVLLRHLETAEYYGPHTWVIDPAEAHDFVKTEDAVRFSKENNLSQLEVVLRYEKPPSEMTFRVE